MKLNSKLSGPRRSIAARCALPAVAAALACALPVFAQIPASKTPVVAKPAAPASAPATAATFSHGRFVDIPIRMAVGEMKRFVFWFVDGAADARRSARLAEMTGDGAMVAVVDTSTLEKVLRKDGGRCVFSAGDVENFSRYVQAYYKLPTYRSAIVLGDGEGAGLAYAMVAQATKGTFAGAVSSSFCPVLRAAKAICSDESLKVSPPSANGSILARLQPGGALGAPWFYSADPSGRCASGSAQRFADAIPGARELKPDAAGDTSTALRVALQQIGAQREVSVAPPPADLAGLPIVEVPSIGKGNDTSFAVFASGDGGWAGLDKEVAGALAQQGIPVAGIDSLRYFWTARTPQVFAGDLDRIVRYYAHRWNRKRVLLIGFSQGADVLPAAINRLPATTSRMVALNALMSIGKNADYEFHVSNWLGGDSGGLPIAPEMAKLPRGRTLCLYGAEDEDAICPSLKPGQAIVEKLPGDHHFDGDYQRLANVILRTAQAVEAQPPPP